MVLQKGGRGGGEANKAQGGGLPDTHTLTRGQRAGDLRTSEESSALSAPRAPERRSPETRAAVEDVVEGRREMPSRT